MQFRYFALLLLAVSFSVSFVSGQQPQSTPQPRPTPNQEESSSRDTLTDLNSPDPREHAANEDVGDVEEAHSFDPHRAAKDLEIADYYYKRGNYRGAIERYREALEVKPNDAEATFGIARCEEKLGNPASARASYEAYLKILPDGPRAKDSKKAVEHLKKLAKSSGS